MSRTVIPWKFVRVRTDVTTCLGALNDAGYHGRDGAHKDMLGGVICVSAPKSIVYLAYVRAFIKVLVFGWPCGGGEGITHIVISRDVATLSAIY